MDTTSDPRWQALHVVAHLTDPVVTARDPMHLDGPLSWCAWLAAQEAGVMLPPMSDEQVVDFALPVATWTRPAPAGVSESLLGADGMVWGWCCSRASWMGDGSTVVEIRKRPPLAELARFTADARYHSGLGPHKARSVPRPGRLASAVEWWCLGDPDGVTSLMARLRSLGGVSRHGNGRVGRVTVTVGSLADRGRWMDRDMPAVGGIPGAVRAPYWHVTRRCPIVAGAPC